MEPAHILVIEDDEIVARTIKRSLRSENFPVEVATNGLEGLKQARQNRPMLVILDVIMPGMDGYAVCRELRADPLLETTPILFLTAKIKEQDKIAGFVAGGDDYLSKPFNLDELILRVKAILRRTHPTSAPAATDLTEAAVQNTVKPVDHCIYVGAYTLDTRSYEVETPTQGKILLTPVQYDLLYHLMTHPEEIFSPARLLDEVWDYPTDRGSPDLVRVHIKTLRERIEVDPRAPKFIRTVPGYGYTVAASDEAESEQVA
jgi:DNA-binding response OmpR family regulator